MNELIRIENGEVCADSRMIAEHFEKEHRNVLADIKDEIEKIGEEGLLIFQQSSYINQQNREMPCFIMNEEGLMQLAARYDAVARRKLIVKIKELKAQNHQMAMILTDEQKLQLAIFNAKSAQEASIAAAELDRYRAKQIESLSSEVVYKDEIITGFVSDLDILTKRDIINRVVRHERANFQERWRELYRVFNETYHIDIKKRCDNYNAKCSKKKDHLSLIGYAEKFEHINKLYAVAVKLFETDINEILETLKPTA
jgi:Rha family phage regulatory protein